MENLQLLIGCMQSSKAYHKNCTFMLSLGFGNFYSNYVYKHNETIQKVRSVKTASF